MAIKTAIELQVKQPSLKGFRQELRQATIDAQNAVIKFGEFSPEARKAELRVAALRDKMDDFNDRVNAVNPDKFAQVNTVVTSVSRGFQAAQGAMALFGSESQSLEKTLVKLQGAMALAEGLEGLGKMQQQFGAIASLIKDKVVTAFSTLKGALTATGIGAAAVAVGFLIEKLMTLKTSEELAAEKVAKMSKELENQKIITDSLNQSISNQVSIEEARLKSIGANEQEISKARQKGIEQQIANLEALKKQYADEGVRQIQLNNQTARNSEERNKKRLEIIQKYDTDVADIEKKIAELQTQYQIAYYQNEEKIRLDREAKAKNAAELRKKRLDEQIQNELDVKNKRQDILNETLKIESKGLEISQSQIINHQDEVNIKFIESEKTKFEQLTLFAKAYYDQLGSLALDTLEVIDQLNLAYAKKDEASQRKAFELSKKLNIAQTIISTIQGAQNAYTTAAANPINTATFGAYAVTQAALALATGFAKVKMIQNQQYNSSSMSGASNNSPNIGVNIPNMQSGSTLQQDAMGGKVYVLEGDIRRVTQRVNANRMVSVSE